MDIIGRVKNICVTPQTEWSVIAEENTPPASLITEYVLPLAAIGAVAGFIGGSLVGQTVPFLGTYRTPLATGLGVAVYSVIAAVLGVFLISVVCTRCRRAQDRGVATRPGQARVDQGVRSPPALMRLRAVARPALSLRRPRASRTGPGASSVPPR